MRHSQTVERMVWHPLPAVLIRVVLMLAALALAACSGNYGLPSEPGFYEVRTGSVSFDGERYQFVWLDKDGGLHPAEGRDIRLVQGQRNLLEVGNGSPVLHLREDEPVTVKGADDAGVFDALWFPFVLGRTMPDSVLGTPRGHSGPPPTVPRYRYPPTGTFGRGDSLEGSLTTDRPVLPDYSRMRPAPATVSGQSGGTGGGTAGSGKGTAAVSGQAGGAGGGLAVSSKGGFLSGPYRFSMQSQSRPSFDKGGPNLGSRSGASVGTPGARSTGGLVGKASGGARGLGALRGRR